MEKIKVIVERSTDGTYGVYSEDSPMLHGLGDSVESAKCNFFETLSLTKSLGKESALCYPDWLEKDCEYLYRFDMPSLLEYYSGIITPTALGKMSGINPKQMWNYMHGISRPRKAQSKKIEEALHRFGAELSSISL